jgi:NADPH:quinone reductase-like Zn-dependent oxidoreductase
VNSSIAQTSEASTDAARGGTMKAIVGERYGSPDVLELRDVPLPEIEDHQVLVRVHASSVNASEWYRVLGPVFARVGNGLRRPKSAAIGADLAGTVEAVGKDITEFQTGDEVFGTSGYSWAEYAPSREPRLVKKPANVSFEEAASVPVAALTALQALRDHGNVQPGQKVLINGASGGVGSFAVQIAKALGAEVTAVCSSQNVETARSGGADVVVDYTQDDFTKSGVRHDLMLDIAGSRPFRQFGRVLTPDATLVLVGGPMNTRLGPLPHFAATTLSALVRRRELKSFIAKIEKDDLLVMQELLANGTVKPVIDRSYPLSQVPDALRYLGEGHARGKVVITM